MTTRLRAFHGTRSSRLEPILAAGLKPSLDDDEWLGAGSYFFVDGLNDPRGSAFEWARVEMWDKKARCFAEQEVAVLEYAVELDLDHVFDLRETNDAQEFHRARRSWLRSTIPRRSTHRPRPPAETYDTQLLNEFKVARGVCAMIADFHIQLSIRERHFRLDSRIPNVAVLCVTHPLVPPTTIDVVGVEILPVESTPEAEVDS